MLPRLYYTSGLSACEVITGSPHLCNGCVRGRVALVGMQIISY